MVFTFLVGRARSPESGGLSSPDARPKRDTTPLPWSTVDPALHLLRQQRWHRRSRSNLDGDLRLRYQIAIPVRVSVRASGGGAHDQAVALGPISHWSTAAL